MLTIPRHNMSRRIGMGSIAVLLGFSGMYTVLSVMNAPQSDGFVLSSSTSRDQNAQSSEPKDDDDSKQSQDDGQSTDRQSSGDAATPASSPDSRTSSTSTTSPQPATSDSYYQPATQPTTNTSGSSGSTGGTSPSTGGGDGSGGAGGGSSDGCPCEDVDDALGLPNLDDEVTSFTQQSTSLVDESAESVQDASGELLP